MDVKGGRMDVKKEWDDEWRVKESVRKMDVKYEGEQGWMVTERVKKNG